VRERQLYRKAAYERASTGGFILEFPVPDLSWAPQADSPLARRSKWIPPQSFAFDDPQAAPPPPFEFLESQIDSVQQRPRRGQPQSFAFDFPQEAPPPPFEFWETKADYFPRRTRQRAPYERPSTGGFLIEYQVPSLSWLPKSDDIRRELERRDSQSFGDPQIFEEPPPPPPVTFWEPRFEVIPRRLVRRTPYERASTDGHLISYPPPAFTWLPIFQEYVRPQRRMVEAQQVAEPVGMFTAIPFSLIIDVEFESLPMMRVDYEPAPSVDVEYEPAPVFDAEMV
jgi:hypothetical protein